MSNARFVPPAIVIAILVVRGLFVESMRMTGDEPRYVSSGLGLYTSVRQQPAPAVWDRFVTQSELPRRVYTYATVASSTAQSLAPGLAYGRALLLFGLNGARCVNLGIGAVGLALLFATLRTYVRHDRRGSSVATLSLAISHFRFSLTLVYFIPRVYERSCDADTSLP